MKKTLDDTIFEIENKILILKIKTAEQEIKLLELKEEKTKKNMKYGTLNVTNKFRSEEEMNDVAQILAEYVIVNGEMRKSVLTLEGAYHNTITEVTTPKFNIISTDYWLNVYPINTDYIEIDGKVIDDLIVEEEHEVKIKKYWLLPGKYEMKCFNFINFDTQLFKDLLLKSDISTEEKTIELWEEKTQEDENTK